MLGKLKNIFDSNKRELARLAAVVVKINSLEPDFEALTDAELTAKTMEFRQRLSAGETLDQLLPEAFAAVREAAKRTLGQRHFDVQLMGGIVLHEGRIAEMKTGEGKTLAATLPAYLNALAGKGVHIVTVNDYLARRDAEWMGQIYRFLGMSVGVIVHGLDFKERFESYRCDITYGTNNEFGFDYLRDNMVRDPELLVQRELYYAIIDEVDSILIDEARTPLIISGTAEDSSSHYQNFSRIVPRLRQEEDYTVDEKARTVAMTETGVAKVEKMLGIDNLFNDRNFSLNHYLIQALKAHTLFRRDRDYVVKDGEVIIVDEFTGRLMPGRRYSDGLHQAIEAKENVKVAQESQTLASITFQNYFRMYEKLAGMTGTAATEEEEFRKIYGMDVVVIPTNRPMIRVDHPDLVYKTEAAKFRAVVGEIEEKYKKGQPVLVGTISIEKSEVLSQMLQKIGIPHQVLNAKHHEREAEIVKDAGQRGVVTIATNMAGRGTDIVLGEGIAELGGLHVIGTERHESRRIDNQLRGRSGRQGDPGSSRFYVSLEDDLMRLFGSDRISGLMDRLGWEEDQPIENMQITRAIENAQKKVEHRNFEIRRQVLEYDNILNQQREIIYQQRRQVLLGTDIQEYIQNIFANTFRHIANEYVGEKIAAEEWNLDGLIARYQDVTARLLPFTPQELAAMSADEMAANLAEQALEAYAEREKEYGPEAMRRIEYLVLLQTIDAKWMEHLREMDGLREGIGLRAYGQQDPLMEYRFEAYQMFNAMIQSIQEDCIRMLFRVRLVERGEAEQEAQRRMRQVTTNRDQGSEPPQPRTVTKIGRNDPCPCGSGKKYKKCCGK
ncbi:MAG: preprotein translocase subunit SecA [Firmicutes bacterium]|nr:preprotein translocase subunit SecA [Bacillota bacterium]NLL89240.1 preprotein translocase subunit SecA [Bacillota bacterium]